VSSEPASGLSGLDAAEVEGVIAPALELAVVVARVSAQLRPPVPVPRSMRALVRFAKLPASARPAVRKALEDDEAFRGRVAAAGDQLEVPRASWLFLHRPTGWDEELAGLVRQAIDADAASDADRSDRALRRRVAGAEAAAVRLEAALDALRADSTQAAEELASERRSRRDAEDQLGVLRHRAEAAERERDQARRRLEELSAELGRARAELERVSTEATLGAEERRALVDEAAAARTAAARADVASSRLATQLAHAFGDAAQAAVLLGRAIATAAEALGGADPLGGAGPLGGDAERLVALDERPARAPVADLAAARAGPPAVPTPSRAARAASRPRPGRVPHPLPPAVFDDSREAAEHLVRVPGMLVLVDGYNVTLSAWQDLPISAQRSRLVDACSELVARSGADVMIVFDGAEEPADLPADLRARGPTSRVHWRFSPVDVEADDVLLDLVAELEPERPVTVASSDRRVRDGARRLGANAISTPQLLAVLRREPSAGSGGMAAGS
jgi:predicted RNA-binding protein with PIN domain